MLAIHPVATWNVAPGPSQDTTSPCPRPGPRAVPRAGPSLLDGCPRSRLETQIAPFFPSRAPFFSFQRRGSDQGPPYSPNKPGQEAGQASGFLGAHGLPAFSGRGAGEGLGRGPGPPGLEGDWASPGRLEGLGARGAGMPLRGPWVRVGHWATLTAPKPPPVLAKVKTAASRAAAGSAAVEATVGSVQGEVGRPSGPPRRVGRGPLRPPGTAASLHCRPAQAAPLQGPLRSLGCRGQRGPAPGRSRPESPRAPCLRPRRLACRSRSGAYLPGQPGTSRGPAGDHRERRAQEGRVCRTRQTLYHARNSRLSWLSEEKHK